MGQRLELQHVRVAPRINRRDVAKALGVGAGLVAAGGVLRAGSGLVAGASAQTDIAATPPSPPSAAAERVSYGPTVASKAAELGFDLDRIFRFVAGEVRYEPYAGALRGPDATLWGLAGNSVDSASLLAALLGEAQIVWRYAAGPLHANPAAASLQAVTDGVKDLPASYQRALDASLAPTPTGIQATPAATPDGADDDIGDDVVADVIARATFARDAGDTRYEALATMLPAALDQAGIAIAPVVATALPDLELTRHVWIQVADGPNWIDYDPTLADARAATAIADVAETFAAIPDDLQHTVSVRISAETLSGTSIYPTDVVSASMTAAQAATAPIEIGVAPPTAMAAAGFAISDALGGGGGCYPYLAAGDTMLQSASSALPFTTGGGALGALDSTDATPAAIQDGDLVAISYTVDVASPGADPVSVTRYLFDRLTPVARATVASGVDPATIAPLAVISVDGGNAMPAQLAATTYLTVQMADLPGGYVGGASDPGLAGIGSIGLLQAGLWASSLRGRISGDGMQALVAAPQLAAFTVGMTSDDDPDAGLLLSGDLLWQARTIISSGDASVGGVHPAMAAGILAQVAEDIAVAPEFLRGTASLAMTAGPSVGRVFAEAAKTKVPILVLSSAGTTAIPDDAGEASTLVQAALDAGRVVVIPAAAVTLDGKPAIGWWEVDPGTGRTVDVLANGKGYAESRIAGNPVVRMQDLPEEGAILTEVNTWRPWYQRLGRCAGMVAMIAGAAVDPTSINPGALTAAGAAKLALRAYMRNPNILNNLKNLANCY
ncbi:MAG: hypothetical protein QM753_03990 [Thermomicrobiales bacterium]